jgi:hypothetical protein
VGVSVANIRNNGRGMVRGVIEERKRVGIGEINGEEQKRGCPS